MHNIVGATSGPQKKILRSFSRLQSTAVGFLLISAFFPFSAGAAVQTNTPLYLKLKHSGYLLYQNETGISATFSSIGAIDIKNEFFQVLGTNGRSCVNCHQPREGWSLTPAAVSKLFSSSKGKNPLFRTNDGSNSPNADVSTLSARRAAYSMLISKAVIRVGLPVPENAEFELAAVDDPYKYASAKELSLFRRPLPSTNMRFLSTVMWDGRETFDGQKLHYNLESQANGATVGHAQSASPLTAEQKKSIADFEFALYSAQVFSKSAQWLDSNDGNGGAQNVASQIFYVGINDILGDRLTHAAFNSEAIALYQDWRGRSGSKVEDARAAIARGEELFNSKKITISGVSGFNDDVAFGNQETIEGTCTSCHNTPNVGGHSVMRFMNLGVSDVGRRTPDMPLYTLKNKTSGEEVQTTDPGRALISGKWSDIGRFKSPVLRNLAARPPYFHDGSAATLADVITHYNDRFNINLTDQEKSDLLAFLNAL